MRQQSFRTYLLIVVFLAIIAFPLVNSYTGLVSDIPSFENRAMAPRPDPDIKRLDPFPVKYDKFYNDHFNLRNRLIRCFNIYNVMAYRKSPVPSVVIGANNWLYLAGDEMDSYMGRNRLSLQELQSIQHELEYRQAYLAEQGIRFYFMAVPCKASIHTENIGYEYFRMSEDSWGEQLNTYLQKNSSLKPIDVFDSLRRYKKGQHLFYKLDNHWNDLGAFYTANEVFKRMRADFPGIELLDLNDFELDHSEVPAGNLEKMLGNLGLFSESVFELHPRKGFKAQDGELAYHPPVEGFAYPWEYELVREIKDSLKPRLLIISDSFGKNIFPFLAENFSKTVKIFDSWQYKLNEDIVAYEQPDAVLLMINEPILRSLLDHQSGKDKK